MLAKESPKKTKSLVDYLISTHLWPENSSNILQILCYLCSEIQLCSIILWFQFTYISNPSYNGLTRFLKRLSEIISLHDVLIQSGSEFIESTSYFLHFLFFLLLMGIIHNFLKKRELNALYKTTITLLAQIHVGVMYWISSYCLLRVIAPNRPDDINSTIISYGIGARTAHIILVVFSTILALGWSACSFGPLRGRNLFASRSPSFQILGTCTRFIFIIFTAGFESKPGMRVIVSLLSSLILIVRLIFLCKQLSFYELRPLKFCAMMTGIQASLSLSGFILTIIKDSEELKPSTLVYFQVLFTPFVIIFLWRYIENAILSYLGRDSNLLQSDEDVYRQYFAIKNVIDCGRLTIQNGKPRVGQPSILYFMGKIINYPDIYKQHLSNNSEKNIFELYKQQEELLLNYLLENMKSYANKKRSFRVKLLLANEMVEKDEFGIALYYLLSIKKKELGIIDKAIVDYLLETTEELIVLYYNQPKTDVISVQSIVQYESQYNKIINMILNISTEYINFWKKYGEPKPHMGELIAISHRIEKSDDQLQLLWNTFSDTFGKHISNIAPTYSYYLHQIRNAPWKAEKILSKAFQFEKQKKNVINEIITEDNIEDKSNIVVIIAFSKQNLGTIRYVSKNISALGYQPEKCMGLSLFDLWPPFMQEGHTSIFANILEKEQLLSSTNIKRIGYLKAAAGFYVPAYAYASVHPYIQNEFQYVGVAKPLLFEKEFLVVRPSGTIEVWSQKIGELLGLSGAPLKNIEQILSLNKTNELKKFILLSFAKKIRERSEEAKGYSTTMTQLLSHQKDEAIVLFSETKRIRVSADINKATFFSSVEVVIFDLEILEVQLINKEDPFETETIPIEAVHSNVIEKVKTTSNKTERFKYLNTLAQKRDEHKIYPSVLSLKKIGKSISSGREVQEEGLSFIKEELGIPLANIADDDTYSMSSQINRNSSKLLEEAIYSVKLPKFLQCYYFLILGFVIMSLIFLIIILIKMNNK